MASIVDQYGPFLRVEEAARLLRISRTSAYALANRWLDTDGAEGLPASHRTLDPHPRGCPRASRCADRAAARAAAPAASTPADGRAPTMASPGLLE